MAAPRNPNIDNELKPIIDKIDTLNLDNIQKESITTAILAQLVTYKITPRDKGNIDNELKKIKKEALKNFSQATDNKTAIGEVGKLLDTILANFDVTHYSEPEEKKEAKVNPALPPAPALVVKAAAPAAADAPAAPEDKGEEEKELKEEKKLKENEVKELTNKIAAGTLDNLAKAFVTKLQTNFQDSKSSPLPLTLSGEFFATISNDAKAKAAIIESLFPPTEEKINKEVKKIADLIKSEEKKIDRANPLEVKAEVVDASNCAALQIALVKIQKDYTQKTNDILRTTLTQMETNLRTDEKSSAPGFSLARIMPVDVPEGKTEVKEDAEPIVTADLAIISSLKKYMKEKGTEEFKKDFNAVIMDQNDPSANNPNALVTKENLAELTSLNNQYRALTAVNKMVSNLEENLDVKSIVAPLQSPVIIKSLSTLILDKSKNLPVLKNKDAKTSAEVLKKELIGIIKIENALENPVVIDKVKVTDGQLITALEKSRQNYRVASLEKEIHTETEKIHEIAATIQSLSVNKTSEIKGAVFQKAKQSTTEATKNLKTIAPELKQLVLVPSAKISSLQKDIDTLQASLIRDESIIGQVEKVELDARAIINVMPLFSTVDENIIAAKNNDSKEFLQTKERLENAINLLPRINAWLNAPGPKIKETQDMLKKHKDTIEELHAAWKQNWHHVPLTIKKQVEEAESLRSITPSQLKTMVPDQRHHALTRLFNMYTYNWKMTRFAKIVGGYYPQKQGAPQPNAYLAAINSALEENDNKTKLQLHIDSINDRLDKLDNNNPKDQKEAIFLTAVKENLQELQTEMKEIKDEIDKKVDTKITHAISVFSAEPRTFSSYEQAVTEINRLLPLAQRIDENSDVKSRALGSGAATNTGILYKESLPAYDANNYDWWNVYHSPTKKEKGAKEVMTDPTVPIILTHESNKNSIRRSEDYILSITPSDQSLLIDILIKHAVLLDSNNPGEQLKSRSGLGLTELEKREKWQQYLQYYQAPICLDNMDKLRNLIKSLSESSNDILFTGPLASTSQGGDDISLRTKKIVTLLDQKRYKNGMPEDYYIKLAKDYLERKYDDIKNNRCPYPVELSSNSKPLLQAWQCILVNSPDMHKVFTIDPSSKKFAATPKQLKIAKEDPTTTYVPRSEIAKLAKVTINQEADVSKPGFLQRLMGKR